MLQDNPLDNLNLAFDIAERYLDIPKMLDAEGELFKLSFTVSLKNLFTVRPNDRAIFISLIWSFYNIETDNWDTYTVFLPKKTEANILCRILNFVTFCCKYLCVSIKRLFLSWKKFTISLFGFKFLSLICEKSFIKSFKYFVYLVWNSASKLFPNYFLN